jgi:hypothetical protein
MTKLTWDDLLIRDLKNEDCREWLAHWSWLVGGKLAPEFLNKFGSWFLRRSEGSVEMLDVLNGTIEKVAETYEEFIASLNQQSWQEHFLLSKLVYELHQHGKIPGPGQCYALAPHPAIGGPNPTQGQKVDPRFVSVMDIAVWQSLCSQFLHA